MNKNKIKFCIFSVLLFYFFYFISLQWFYRIVVVGVLYRIRSVYFGPYISRTENPNDLRPCYSELSDQN
jgi:hypothetical protein